MVIIDDGDTWRTEKLRRYDDHSEVLNFQRLQDDGNKELKIQNVLGEQVVEKIVEHVVDKIHKEVNTDA